MNCNLFRFHLEDMKSEKEFTLNAILPENIRYDVVGMKSVMIIDSNGTKMLKYN